MESQFFPIQLNIHVFQYQINGLVQDYVISINYIRHCNNGDREWIRY